MTLVIDAGQMEKRQTVYDPQVEYWLYTDKSDTVTLSKDFAKQTNAKPKSGLCFSEFLRTVQGTALNRLAYRPRIHREKLLTDEQVERWIEASVEWKMFPSYLTLDHLHHSHFVFRFDDIPPSQLYVYLCHLRHLEEWPDIVRIALHLVDDFHVDPYLAVAMGSKIGCGNSGHNYIAFGYGFDSKPNNKSLPVRTALALKWFIEEPKKYDARTCHAANGSFNCWSTIQQIVAEVPDVYVPPEQFDHPEIIAAMQSKTVEAATDHLKAFQAFAGKVAA